MTSETKEAIKRAAAAIDETGLAEADKADVAENLKKCADELDKPAPELGRVSRFIKHIEELAPSVAAIIKGISVVASIFGA